METDIGRTETILVVDDDPSILDVLESTLRWNGYTVVRAEDGLEGLRQVSEATPDLILLDLMMPGLTGQEVCRKIKADPETRGIPVIVVTARDAQEDLVQCLEMGADDFVAKPFEIREVLSRIRSHLRVKHYHDELVKQQRELELTLELSRLFSSEKDLDALLDAATDKIKEATGALRARILARRPDHPEPGRHREDEGLLNTLGNLPAMVLTPAGEGHRLCCGGDDQIISSPHSLLLAPVRYGDSQLGVVALAIEGLVEEIDHVTRTFLTIATNALALALKNAFALRTSVLAQLAGAAAHELNQPLTSVMGCVDLLRAGLERGEVDQALTDLLYSETSRMAEIVRRIGQLTQYRTRDYVRGIKILDLGVERDEDPG